MSKISVLMSTYREPLSWIDESVHSIVNQTYQDIEYIIIVDDPQNLELVSYLKQIQNKYHNIKLIINEQNIGLVKSLNKGLEICTGEYVARMDADDISFADRLKKQLAYMEEKEYDIVGCNYEVFFNDTIIRMSSCPTSNSICRKVLQYESCLAHPAWLVKTNVYQTLNGYRDIDACEDLDFLQRAVIAGFKVGNCPDVLLRYRDNPYSISHLKIAKQRVMAKKISSIFRKGRIISQEEYLDFLDSKKYKNSCALETRLFNKENIIHSSEQPLIEKIRIYIILYTSASYLIRKINRIKVKRWKCEKDED